MGEAPSGEDAVERHRLEGRPQDQHAVGRERVDRRHDPGERLATRAEVLADVEIDARSLGYAIEGRRPHVTVRRGGLQRAQQRLDRDAGRGRGLREGQVPAATGVDAQALQDQQSVGRPKRGRLHRVLRPQGERSRRVPPSTGLGAAP